MIVETLTPSNQEIIDFVLARSSLSTQFFCRAHFLLRWAKKNDDEGQFDNKIVYVYDQTGGKRKQRVIKKGTNEN